MYCATRNKLIAGLQKRKSEIAFTGASALSPVCPIRTLDDAGYSFSPLPVWL